MEITLYNRQEVTTGQQFSTSLFYDFVEWIDRGEICR